MWISFITILATGYWMLFGVFGGMANVGLYVHAMHGLGLLMVAIFLHVYFAPFKRLKQAVAAQDWPAGKKQIEYVKLTLKRYRANATRETRPDETRRTDANMEQVTARLSDEDIEGLAHYIASMR